MLKAKFLYFYISIIFGLIGIFFPTYVSGAIGFDIGDFINWSFGLYLHIPLNPIEETRFYYHLNIGIILTLCIFWLIGTIYYDIRKIKREKEFDSKSIVIIVISVLIINSIYLSSDLITLMLFGVAFEFSSIFALIGTYQVNEYLIMERYKKRKWNIKTQKLFGILILAISLGSLIYLVVIFFMFAYPFGLTVVISDYIQTFPTALLFLLILIFGVVYIRKSNKISQI
jgi:hypothetical protein